MKRILRSFICVFLSHDWTSKAIEGIPPDDKDIADGLRGFNRYATMYCGRCLKVSELNKKANES